MRPNHFLPILASLVALMLGGCGMLTPTPSPPPPQPVKVTAIGHGTLSNPQYSQYNQSQQKLMAMRAAKLDAYRNLAEQVYGFRLSGTTTISAFANQRDYVRVSVDAYVRGARVIDVRQLPDGSYEATVEAELPADIHQCLVRGDCPQPPKPSADCVEGACTPAPPTCTGTGCSSASGSSLKWGAAD